jgi:serine/threonine-protein kinase
VRFGVIAGAAQFARLLAIKQLNPMVSRNPAWAARFREEVRIHARVRHPNVVELVDVVEGGGESWLVMEHVDGATLGTILLHRRASGRPLELQLAVGIVSPLLRGLHGVHETRDDAGLPLCIVHGGVSPRHVMVDRDGQVKLIDFGAARAVGEPPALGPRRAPGRFGHLSPELVLGEQVDRRSDVFAAGILLWEAIAGRSLFEERGLSDADGLRRVLRAPIPDLRSIRAETPKALAAVVNRALERDRARRFATAEDFALALEAAIAPASPLRLAALMNGLSARHFEPSQRALAAVRRSLPPPLTTPGVAIESDGDEDTSLELTTRFVHGDTLAPANTELNTAARSSAGRVVALTVIVSALAVCLIVAFWRPAARASGRVAPPSLTVNAGAALPEALAPAPLAETVDPVAEPIPVEALPLGEPPPAGEAEPSLQRRRRSGHALGGRQSRAMVAGDVRSVSCSPPTYLGEDGIRHFKEHCL